MSFSKLTNGELLTAAIIGGIATWEPFTSESGELCFSGVRHHVTIGLDLQPELSKDCRNRLEEHMSLKLDNQEN